MHALPVKLMAFGLAFVICAGALILGSLPAGKAASEDLQVSAVAVSDPEGQVELRITWHWQGVAAVYGRHRREELLAVSFDTSRLVFDSEHAPLGKGANGDTLKRLQRVAKPDGARRLYVIPEALDGSVVIRFRTVYPGQAAKADPFRIWLVSADAAAPSWVREMEVTVAS